MVEHCEEISQGSISGRNIIEDYKSVSLTYFLNHL